MKLQNLNLWSAQPWLRTGAVWREFSPAAQPGPETLSQLSRRDLGPGLRREAGGRGSGPRLRWARCSDRRLQTDAYTPRRHTVTRHSISLLKPVKPGGRSSS